MLYVSLFERSESSLVEVPFLNAPSGSFDP